MKISRLFTIACLAVLGAAGAAHADPVGFDPDGTGAAGSAIGRDGLDANGSGFVMLLPDPAGGSTFGFVEVGAYRLTGADGSSALGRQDITLTYSLQGTLDATTGTARFNGGAVDLYADARFNFGAVTPGSPVVYGANDGTHIGAFAVTAGGGQASGTVTLQADAVAGSLAPGYFMSTAGADMATQPLQLAVQIGNAIDPNPSAAVVAEIVCKAASFPGPGCIGGSYANGAGWFVVTDHALATMSAVPEPATPALALAGLAVVGGAVRRRRAP